LNNASQKSPFEPKRGSGLYYQIVTKYREVGMGNKKGSRFHGSLIKSIAFPQKLLKRTPFEEIYYPIELPIKFRNRLFPIFRY
jgi:hypothetical protein